MTTPASADPSPVALGGTCLQPEVWAPNATAITGTMNVFFSAASQLLKEHFLTQSSELVNFSIE